MGECCHTQAKPKPWFFDRLFLISLLIFMVIFLGSYVTFLTPLREALLKYLGLIFVPILLGFLIGGMIDFLIPAEYISTLLSQKKKRSILFAVLAGFLMSACSHGILALSMALYKKGASVPAVIAFLLASPWANLPLTIIMFGFFGLKAFLIIGGAVLIAIITGFIFLFLDKKDYIEKNPHTLTLSEDFSIIEDLRLRMKGIRLTLKGAIEAILAIFKGGVSLAKMVLWWILLGAFLASLSAAYIPAGFMAEYMGPSLLGLLVTLILATIIEVCSEGTAPLAFEIFRSTGALGNSFTFLMAGVVTDYTEIGLIWQNIGRRTAIFLPLITVPQVILLAVLMNLFL